MKSTLSMIFAVAVAVGSTAFAEDSRVKWLAKGVAEAHTQYVYAGRYEGKGIWVATDDNPGGYDVMHEVDRSNDHITLKSTKYQNFSITLTSNAAVHRQPGTPNHTIPGSWNERVSSSPKADSKPKNPSVPNRPEELAKLEWEDNPDSISFGKSVYVRNLSDNRIEVTVKSAGTNNNGTKAEDTNVYTVLPKDKVKVGSTKGGGDYTYRIVTAKKL